MSIRVLAASLACLLGGAFLCAAQEQPDSLRVEELQEVVIGAVRAAKNAPFAVANISRKELQDFSTTGIELPMLLARTPGILAWSENGVGTGTSYMRIRGAGGSRINVTLDGVPLNSPEDQTVFWANMNSYGALMGSVQVQRGVGSSTNGDGAFGGTIALGTRAPSLVPTAEFNASYGSWNTRNLGVSASSGLLGRHLILEGGYHQTTTDGYLHGTAGRSGNWFGGLTWLGRDFKLSYKLLGNFEVTGQAWNGVSTKVKSPYEAQGIGGYSDLCDLGIERYNSLYEMLNYLYIEPWLSQMEGRTIIGNYALDRYRMSDGSFWPGATDNFWQTHHILNFAWDINPYWTLSVSPHYTHGYGYYEEFRYQNKLTKFGLPQMNGVKKADFVRQKGLTQDSYGVVSNFKFRKDDWDLTGGLSVQQFKGNHFGYLTYADQNALSVMTLLNTPIFDENGNLHYHYYDSDAAKTDASAFLKAAYALNPEWSVFGDLQFRHVDYRTDGYNDKYYVDDNGVPQKHFLDVDVHYNFFNPKAGVNFSRGGHRAYASFAMSHREPERNNFTDNGKYPFPRAERLLDWEAGYQWSARHFQLGVNLYYMRYKDQLVQTGELSDIGEALTTNIPDSYRTGVELTTAWELASWLSVEGNAALSRNRLLDFDEYVEDWENGVMIVHYDDAPLAYSPAAILNSFLNLHFGTFSAVWHTGYVSRMFLDNSGSVYRSLPGYSLTNLMLSYRINPRKVLKQIELGVDFRNLFSARVAQSGWVYSAVSPSSGYGDRNRYCEMGFMPVAPLTVLGHITLKF